MDSYAQFSDAQKLQCKYKSLIFIKILDIHITNCFLINFPNS
jgi:hypothetical protein